MTIESLASKLTALRIKTGHDVSITMYSDLSGHISVASKAYEFGRKPTGSGCGVKERIDGLIRDAKLGAI